MFCKKEFGLSKSDEQQNSIKYLLTLQFGPDRLAISKTPRQFYWEKLRKLIPMQK